MCQWVTTKQVTQILCSLSLCAIALQIVEQCGLATCFANGMLDFHSVTWLRSEVKGEPNNASSVALYKATDYLLFPEGRLEMGGGCRCFYTEVFRKTKKFLIVGDNCHNTQQRKPKKAPAFPCVVHVFSRCALITISCIQQHTNTYPKPCMSLMNG